MNSANLRDFEIDPQALRAPALRRLAWRGAALAALLMTCGAAVQAFAPPAFHRVAWTFGFTVAAVYVAVEISALQWTRRSAPNLRLRLAPDALELWIGHGRHRMDYADLHIARVVVRHERVQRIELRARQQDGGVVLAGFRDMDALAEALTSAIAATRTDTTP